MVSIQPFGILIPVLGVITEWHFQLPKDFYCIRDLSEIWAIWIGITVEEAVFCKTFLTADVGRGK